MTDASPGAISGTSPPERRRWEYRAPRGAGLSEILERIRMAPGDDILIDISEHDLLRTDSALRRTLTAAAKDVGRRVMFSLASQELSSPALGTSPSALRSPRAVTSPSAARSLSAHAPLRTQNTRPAVTRPAPVPVSVIGGGSGKRVPSRRPAGFFVAIQAPRVGISSKRLAVIFAFFTGLCATVAILFLAPHADIEIFPDAEPLVAEYNFRAGLDISRLEPEAAVMPARLLTVEEDIREAFPVEHKEQRGARARGMVDLVNRTGDTQRIKQGSRLLGSNGHVYRTEHAAVVPPQGSVPVPVTADAGGVKGNMTEGVLTFAALPDSAAPILFARLREPLGGGTDVLVSTLADEDLARARDRVRDSRAGALRQRLEEQLPPGALSADELFRVVWLTVQSQEPLGSEATTFHITGKLQAQVLLVVDKDALELARAIALARAGDAKTLGRPIPASALRITEVRWDEGEVLLRVGMENVLHTAFDFSRVKERLVGRTTQGALDYLRGLPGVKDARVALRPFWIRRVPAIPRNINVAIVLPEEQARNPEYVPPH